VFAIDRCAVALEVGAPVTHLAARRRGEPFILALMDRERASELLSSERARVERALGQSSPPDGADVTDPFEAADVSVELVEEELGQARAEQLRDELEAIARAEKRLAQGSYGVSVDSGEPIPDARLEAIPWAERTAAEQSRFEAQGR
jgi:DnaK suppressor protein